MERRCLDCGRRAKRTRCDTCERTRHTAAYGGAYRRERAPLMGQPCTLRLPGCTGIATTADHVVAVTRGGSRGPLRPACAHCNYSLGDRGDADGGGGVETGSHGVPNDPCTFPREIC